MEFTISCQKLLGSLMSLTRKGVRHTQPDKAVDILEVFLHIQDSSAETAQTTHTLRSLMASGASKKERNEYKANHFQAVTFSGLFVGGRKIEHLVRHSGYICIDIDGLNDMYAVECTKTTLQESEVLRPILIFTSPSGQGVKAVYPIDISHGDHLQWFKAIEKYLRDELNITVDANCKDVTRLCFLPFDPHAWLSPIIEEEIEKKNVGFTTSIWFKHYRPEATQSRKSQVKSQKSHWTTTSTYPHGRPESRVQSLATNDYTRALNAAHMLTSIGYDITSTYSDWIAVGFALTALGESGRGIFHTVSSLHADYKYAECDRKYTNLMHNANGSTGLGAFFARVKNAGINLRDL